jgi:hypothetical protein
MTDPAPPAWVTKRDGRLEPFEADRISRALFAAGEAIGQPDAFLSRELADGAVHFLAEDCAGATPTTQRIAEVVVQVVRELGHPAIARAFSEHRKHRADPAPPRPLADVLAEAARTYTLQAVYTRDLAAAVEAGLISLSGLQTPGELAGCVLGAPLALTGDLVGDIEQARRFAGQFVAVDGMEYLAGDRLAESLARGLRLTGLSGVVNLNVATPPSRAASLAVGPLFAESLREVEQARTRSDDLLTSLLSAAPEARVDWHLSLEDLGDRERLLSVIRYALDGAPIGFVFDRPRATVTLGEGLSRDRPAALLVAGLHLSALADQPGMLADPDRFLQRLGSLVRLALSAAVQKRAYLRRQPRTTADVTSGFLLDRARFVAVPVGLDDVVRRFTGWGMSNGGPSLDLGRTIVRRLADVLRADGRLAQLDACLGGPFSFTLESQGVAGATPWDSSASLRSQIRAGTEFGTLALFVGDEPPDRIAEALEHAYRQTDIVRVRLLRAGVKQREIFTDYPP